MLSYEANSYIFSKFGPFHILPILIMVFIVLLTIKYKRTLRRNSLAKWIALFFTFFAVTAQIVYIIWSFAFYENWIVTLFPLCITWLGVILAIILYATKFERVFDIFFFISLYAIANLVYPNFGKFGIDHFRYYHFFITNMYVVWSLVYFIEFEKYSINLKSILYENIFFAIFLIVNYLIYVIFGLDNTLNIMDFLKPYLPKLNYSVVKTLGIMFLGNLGVSVVGYIPWVIKKNIDDRKVSMYE